MAEHAAPPSGRIFISYRRDDTAYPAGWLFDRLVDRLGADQVFKDVDSIELGDDFVQVITDAVGATDVLLALIGDRWLTIKDEQGRRRIDDSEDFVRLEIEAALKRGVRVIPILVEGARMPRAEELPPSLAPLARRQALELSPSRFAFDTNRLFAAIEKTLAEVRGERRPTPETGRRPTPETGQERGGWPRRSLLLAGAGVAAAAVIAVVAVLLLGSDSPPAGEVSVTDDFSSNARGWSSNPGGGYLDAGTFRIDSERIKEQGRWGVLASPTISGTVPQNLDLAVTARRVGGSSTEGWGYGLFCRASGLDNLYAFVIRTLHARVEKRTDGVYSYPASVNDETIRSQAPADPDRRRIRGTCVDSGDDAVELSLWVDDDLVGRWIDTEDPHLDGSFGLVTVLNPKDGEAGDTLEVEFDDFAVSEQAVRP